jgi:hypothetical protein
MSVRVSSDEVLEIMGTISVEDTVVDSMIAMANRFVTKIFSGVLSMSEADLADIERWLTAHFIASTLSRQTSEEKVGDAAAVFTGKWDEGLKSTSYGQMVLMLDTTGRIANAGKRGASIYAITRDDWQ